MADVKKKLPVAKSFKSPGHSGANETAAPEENTAQGTGTAPATARGTNATASTLEPAAASANGEDGRVRAVIDAILPDVDAGRFAVKRIAGEPVLIEAHCLTDGHDKLRVVLGWRSPTDTASHEIEMTLLGNDRWTAEFTPPTAGRYAYTVTAWVDHFESWWHELERRDEKNDIRTALEVGATIIDAAVPRADEGDKTLLTTWASRLRDTARNDVNSPDTTTMKALALDPARAAVMQRYADRSLAVSMTRELTVDRQMARFSTWYELFPRSAAPEPGRHGTFRDVERLVPRIAGMGFNVIYLPPIHPIGRINRKGPNNSLTAGPTDVGSPWAIGSQEGGHKDILPQLGSLEDFQSLVRVGRQFDIDIALDIAFQCAPDHPYVTAHPEWFRHRPDGSVQYAENPPKKYQDIYPFDFESRDWRGLWEELRGVMDYWAQHGVRIFRVDNPHTKSFAFWEWVIGEIKQKHPDVIFLAEAFTRPKVMHRLAKLGFSQSYTYFTWRNSKYELTEYFTELAHGPGRDYFRPNVWPNTPDILHEALQSGQRQVFVARLILAATLSANYGIYGPTFELMESAPREHGSEEYRDSEKYQLRHWDLDRPDGLAPLIAKVNRIRNENPALQRDTSLTFCAVNNDQLIAYYKYDADAGDMILTVVNLDPYNPQSGWIELNLDALQIGADEPYQMHDLLSDQRFQWRGTSNYVRLEPWRQPAHVLKLRRHQRREHDFDYYL